LVFVAFLGIPIAEIYVLIQVGQAIGAWWTIALLIVDSLIGSWLLRREGGRAWRALQIAIADGRMPAKELADGILIVLGGTLMISPGFVTDVFGLLAIAPLTRPLGRRLLSGFISRRLIVGNVTNPRRPRPSGDVVQGDVINPEEGSGN
jgi:UPF0716 protein FxsA